MTPLATFTASAPGLVEETAALVERLRQSVVIVRDGGRGSGSGVIWPASGGDGVIVTNHHVAPGDRAHITLSDGRTFEATARTRDPDRDLAILQVQARGLPAARIGDSQALRVGEIVFAVGNPLGIAGAVTVGIVSALPFDGGNQGLIHADVSLAPGNSGGLLATTSGSVIGITSMVRMPGLALAVPSNTVTSLLGRGSAGRAYLGVSLLETPLPAEWAAWAGTPAGFLVTSVATDSPADEAGLLIGDLIVALDGVALRSTGQLSQALASVRPDEAVEVGLIRGGRPQTLRVAAGRTLEEAA